LKDIGNMQDDPQEDTYEIEGFDGQQNKTSRFLKRKTDLNLAQNAQFDEVGSVSKKLGYVQRESALTSTTSTSTSSSTTTSTSTSSSTSTTTT
jgi:hypothetical protein